MDLLGSYDDDDDDDDAPASACAASAAAAPAAASASAAVGVAGDWPSLVFLDVPCGAPRASPRRLAAACAAAARFRAFASRKLVADDDAADDAGAAAAATAAAAAPAAETDDTAAAAAAAAAASALADAEAAGPASEEAAFDARHLPPHVSLSRAFALRRHQIRAYVAALAAALRRAAPFSVRLSAAPSLFVNESRSRSFVALRLEAGEPSVRALLAAVDGVQAAFGREAYFAPATPHVSVLALDGDAAAAAEQEGLEVVLAAGAYDAGDAAALAGGARAAPAAPAAATAMIAQAGGRARASAVEALLMKARPQKRARRADGADSAAGSGAGAGAGGAGAGVGAGAGAVAGASADASAAAAGAGAGAEAAPPSLLEAQVAAEGAPSEWRVRDVCLKVGNRLIRVRLGGASGGPAS